MEIKRGRRAFGQRGRKCDGLAQNEQKRAGTETMASRAGEVVMIQMQAGDK